MIERRGLQNDPGSRFQCIAAFEIVKFDIGAERFGRHREQRRLHHVRQRAFQSPVRQQVTRPNPGIPARYVKGNEKRQPDNVVQMGMCQKQIGILRGKLGDFAPQFAQTGPAVENQPAFPAHDFNTGCVSAIANGIRSGTRDAAARPPELNKELFLAFFPCHESVRSRSPVPFLGPFPESRGGSSPFTSFATIR